MPVLRQRLQRLDAPQGLRRRRRRGNLAESAQLDVLRGDDSAVGARAFVRRVLPAALGEVPAVPPPSFPALHVPLQTLNLVHVRAVAHAEVRVHAALHRERARHRAEPAVPPRRHLPRRARRRLAGLVKPARVLQVHLHVLVAGEHQRGVRHFAQPHVQVIVAVARAAVEERADAAVDDGVAGEEQPTRRASKASAPPPPSFTSLASPARSSTDAPAGDTVSRGHRPRRHRSRARRTRRAPWCGRARARPPGASGRRARRRQATRAADPRAVVGAWPYTARVPPHAFCSSWFPPAWSWCLCVVRMAVRFSSRRSHRSFTPYGSAGSIAAASRVA